jgi:hypothetical protein
VLETFAVHAGSAITFAGTPVIGGDVGAGTAITGIYSLTGGKLSATVDPVLLYASVLETHKAAMEYQVNTTTLDVPEIGGLTFTPGTWRAGTISIVAGATVTLDGQGDPNSVFLFQANTTLLAGKGVNIILTNGATAENVVWAVGTTFTGGINTNFEGSILAGTAIVFGANTVIEGSILAGTAITFGADNDVTGSVVAGSAITFDARNDVQGGIVAVTAITFGASNSVTITSSSPTGSPTAAPTGAVLRLLRGSYSM